MFLDLSKERCWKPIFTLLLFPPALLFPLPLDFPWESLFGALLSTASPPSPSTLAAFAGLSPDLPPFLPPFPNLPPMRFARFPDLGVNFNRADSSPASMRRKRSRRASSTIFTKLMMFASFSNFDDNGFLLATESICNVSDIKSTISEIFLQFNSWGLNGCLK